MIYYEGFIREWLKRAEREEEMVDIGDKYISLYIAFSGWLSREFNNHVKNNNKKGLSDRDKIELFKEYTKAKEIFDELQEGDDSFKKTLVKLYEYNIKDMREVYDDIRFDGSFNSFVEIIYRVRNNLFHGNKNINDNKNDYELVELSYELLLPLFKKVVF